MESDKPARKPKARSPQSQDEKEKRSKTAIRNKQSMPDVKAPQGGRGTDAAASKKEQQQGEDPFAMILTDDALLTPIFEFVGLFEYRFVAILNKRFRRLYSDFQKQRIHQAPVDSSAGYYYIWYEDFSPSLTSTASVAESIKRAKALLSDMKTGKCNCFIKLHKHKGDGASYGSFYHVVYHERISGTNPMELMIFLRDKVAIRYGNLEILQWLRANGCPWDEWTCTQAAGDGQLEVLQWLRANGCPWDDWTCRQAASNGHLEVLKWARANGCMWNESTCSEAASSGHLEMLQWARANGCPWNEWTCRQAASEGHLEVLKWARANGCPWDEWTCRQAASEGHLEVLKWARANGCPWDEWTCSEAASNGHLEVLQWARANGCPE